MKAETISTATVKERADSPARTCQLCGEPIRADNKHGVCQRNPRCTSEYDRLYRAANREKKRERERLFRGANREKERKRKRRYYAANLEKMRDQHRRRVAQRKGRNPLSCMPLENRHEQFASNWQGGEFMYCSVPGCHRVAGWRTPTEIKKNKTGFRCPEHRGVRLPPIKEEDYDYEKIRSSVA